MLVLTHSDFLDTLAHSNPQKRESINRCLAKIKNGEWDGSLRIKRLKGFPKRIWEARVSDADRLIFLFSHNSGSKDLSAATLHVLDVVDHDHIRLMRRRGHSLLSHVLLSLYQPELLESDEQVAPQAYIQWQAEQSFDLGQMKEYAHQIISSGSGPDYAEILTATDLEVWLTEEQIDAAVTPGHCLLSGVAGSGKTTMAVYRMILNCTTEDRQLYVAYSPRLVREAEKLCHRLLPPEFRTDGKTLKRLEFKTFEDVVSNHLGSENMPAKRQMVRLDDFSAWYGKLKEDIPAATVWGEIRSIVKGACLNPKRDLLDRQTYLSLGRKRALELQQGRERIYYVAERYQRWLREKHLFDEIDLCRRALLGFKAEQHRKYTSIICDEIQDFTDLQMEFIHMHHAGGGHLFLTGDINQIIHPSGFRWEEVHAQFYRRDKLQLGRLHLSHNFRSIGTLVTFSTAIQQLRRRLVGGAAAHEHIIATGGRLPQVVSTEEPTLKSHLRQSDHHWVVLVRSDQERDALRRELDSLHIYTVEEVKGLEFDNVVIWRFFDAQRELWQKSLCNSQTLKDTPAIQQELNLLYVAATRPRKRLFLYDPCVAIWSAAEMHGTFEDATPDTLDSGEVVSKEQWSQYGKYYFDHDLFEQAQDCFSRSGDAASALRSQAHMQQRKKNWKIAGETFLLLSDHQSAARMFEAGGLPARAADAFAQAGMDNDTIRCLVQVSTDGGRWAEAAKLWADAGATEKAWDCAKKTKDAQLISRYAAAVYEIRGNHWEAATHYEIVREWTAAAACWRKAQNWSAAAKAYSRVLNYEAARECIRHISSPNEKKCIEIELLLIEGRGVEAYKLAEEHNNITSIIPLFVTAGLTQQAETLKAKVAHRNQEITELEHLRKQLDNGNIRSHIQPRDSGNFDLIDRTREWSARRKIDMNSHDPEPHWDIGLMLYCENMHSKAIVEFQMALVKNASNEFAYSVVSPEPGGFKMINANNSVVHCYLALSLWASSQISEAIKNFQMAVCLAPDRTSPHYNPLGLLEIHYNLGRILYTQGEFHEAIISLNKALEVDPKDYDTEHLLGSTHAMLDNFTAAIAHYEKALVIQPGNRNTRICLEKAKVSKRPM